jgi:hypothetical protein
MSRNKNKAAYYVLHRLDVCVIKLMLQYDSRWVPRIINWVTLRTLGHHTNGSARLRNKVLKEFVFIIIWMMYEKKYILTKAWPGLKNGLTSWLGGITVFLFDPSTSFWIASQMGMGGPWTPQQHTGARSVGVWHPLWLLPSDTIFSSETNWGTRTKRVATFVFSSYLGNLDSGQIFAHWTRYVERGE